MAKSSGNLTIAEEEQYKLIAESAEGQLANFNRHFNKEEINVLAQEIKNLGILLNETSGTISYAPEFSPLDIPYELVYVRHGKTEGNTEPRIFQGQVDYPENQLNSVGIKQAEDAANLMDNKYIQAGWIPDLIVYSPLKRAIDTGSKFASRHPEIPAIVVKSTSEMAFGEWDGQKVIDIEPDSYAHVFYLKQNAIVKSRGPHIVRENWPLSDEMFPDQKSLAKKGDIINPENFVMVLLRMKEALTDVGNQTFLKPVKGRKPRVLMYGHSMVGAAVSILLGHGKVIKEKSVHSQNALGFDGKYIMPNATPTLLLPRIPQQD